MPLPLGHCLGQDDCLCPTALPNALRCETIDWGTLAWLMMACQLSKWALCLARVVQPPTPRSLRACPTALPSLLEG